jgi:hypothetical protein
MANPNRHRVLGKTVGEIIPLLLVVAAAVCCLEISDGFNILQDPDPFLQFST